MEKIRNNNNKKRDAQIKCQIFNEELKEQKFNSLVQKMRYKSAVWESFFIFKKLKLFAKFIKFSIK